VTGVVSATAARVIAIFEDEQEVEAKLLESGHSDVRFFLAMNVKGRPVVELVVFDPDGLVLNVYHHHDALNSWRAIRASQ
jgi:hypothetical protein